MALKIADLKGIGPAERKLLRTMASLEKPAFRAADATEALGISRSRASRMLSRLAAKGWLHRLRRGVYALVPLSSASPTPAVENPLAVAMEVFAPCYISGWTAAQHWSLTEQVLETIVVYSSSPQRRTRQYAGGVTFHVRRVPPSSIFGTVRLWSGTVPIQMADIHRTVIDILDDPAMGGGGRLTMEIVAAYWQSAERDPSRLLKYAARLGRGTIFKRLGYTAAVLGEPSLEWLDACRERVTRGISLLDPGGRKNGPIVTEWGLRINLPMEGGG